MKQFKGFFAGLAIAITFAATAATVYNYFPPPGMAYSPTTGLVMGTATGGAQGAGSINTQGGVFVNGSSVTGGTSLPTGTISLADYSPAHNGTTDDTAAFTAALAACTANGGGSVLIGPYQYLIDSANLTIPTNCSVTGNYWPGGQRPTEDFTTTPFTLVINPAYTISVGPAARLSNVIVRRKGMTVLTNIANAITGVAAFSGTGITCAGNDCAVRNVLDVGFGTLYSTTGFQRPLIDTFYGDGTAGIVIDNAHDIAHLRNIHLWPFVVGNLIFQTATYAVSGAANNGSGLYRVTVPANSVVTGNTVYVSGLVGANSANGKWTATVIDSTHIDLQSSAAAGLSITGTTVNGSVEVTGLSAVSNLAVGQTISGTGIPGGATIAAIWKAQNTVYLSAAATASNSGVTLAIADPAYSSAGNLYLDATQRSGTGITFTNSEGQECTNCFAYGFETGVNVGTGASWTILTNVSVDNNNALQDPTTTGMLINGASVGTTWQGGSVNSNGTALLVNSSSSSTQSITGVTLNSYAGGAAFDFEAGSVSLASDRTTATTRAYASDAINTSYLTGNQFPNTTLYTQTTTGYNNLFQTGSNTFVNSNTAHVGVGIINQFSPWAFNPLLSGTAMTINGFNSAASKGLAINGGFTGSGTTGLLVLTDLNNTNGVGILMTGNGGTTPSKSFRVANGVYQILDNGYANVLFGITDAGNIQVPTHGVTLGSPTGGDEGVGTLNAATNLFVNGSLVPYATASPTMTGLWTFTPSGAGNAVTINAFGSSASKALVLNGGFTGSGTTGLLTMTDANNTNGVGILMTGNGATTPSKFFRVTNGSYQILNNAFTTAIFQLTDAGVVTLGAPLPVASGGTGLATIPAHGVLLGEGTSNVGNVAAMAVDTLLQGQGASADPAAVTVNNCGSSTTALSYSTSTHTFGCQTITASAGTVTSVAAGTGIVASPSPITTTGTISVDQTFSPTMSGTWTFSNSSGTSPITIAGTFNGTISEQIVNSNSGVNAVSELIIGNGTNGIQQGITGANNITPFFTNGPTSQHMFFGGPSIIPLSFGTDGIERMRIAGAGAVTINAPTSGVALTVNPSASLTDAIRIVGTSGGAAQMSIVDGQTGTRAWALQSGYNSGLAPGVFGIFDATAGVTRFAINTTGAVFMPNLAQTSVAQTGTVCWSTTGGQLSVDTTVGCLSSTKRVKQEVENLDVGLAEIMKLHPVSYELRPEYNPGHLGRQVGLIAEDVQQVDPRLVALDDDGLPRGVRYAQMTAVLTRAIQEQQHEIDSLKRQIRKHH